MIGTRPVAWPEPIDLQDVVMLLEGDRERLIAEVHAKTERLRMSWPRGSGSDVEPGAATSGIASQRKALEAVGCLLGLPLTI